MSRNAEVARLLNEISELLEIQGVPFKPRAYQRAALNVESWGEDIELMMQQGRLGEIPGVGEAIQEKITEFLTTGKLPYLEKIKSQVPAGVRELLRLPHVGPKKAMRLYKELKIDSVEALRRAVADHKLRDLKGFGEKSEEDLRKALERQAKAGRRVDFLTATEAAQGMEEHLRKVPGLGRIVVAGSLRRGRDTVGDLDILVEANGPKAKEAMGSFTTYRRVADVMEHGTTRSRVILDNDLQVDLRVIPAKSFGAAMVYFTGSKEHNIAIRSLALKKGFTLNEYALTRKKDDKAMPSSTEEDIYKQLGLPWVPPELRENRGEVELAIKDQLPQLVEVGHLKGDLHTHTTDSDGAVSARAMLSAAAKLGYEYYGISDHSAGLPIANGLSPSRLRRQRASLDRLQGEFPKTRILQGSEMEIRKDGSLDIARADRAQLDYVIGSVHSHFQLDRDEQTQRVLRAMDEGIDVLGHPTGRKVVSRPSIELDLEQIGAMAAERGVLLEIDGSPDRLDLWGEAIFVCREQGAKFVIDSDAHAAPELHYVQYGTVQARRGWLVPEDVLNTRPAKELAKHFGHSKK